MSKFSTGQVLANSYARVGLMGNPSDGFGGNTVSFLISNFSAEVAIEPHHCIEFIPNKQLDVFEFSNLSKFLKTSITSGYYGGIRLLCATTKVFTELCIASNLSDRIQRGFKMSYTSNIPRMVGLSGSSAIVTAAFNALLKFYELSLADLGIVKPDLPQIILDIERMELGISAGLQDRVIQTYGDLVHMSFDNPLDHNLYWKNCTHAACLRTEKNTSGTHYYTPLDIQWLPAMYLLYNTDAAGESGKVHSTVKDRWQRKDPSLVDGMQSLANLADCAAVCLLSGGVGATEVIMPSADTSTSSTCSSSVTATKKHPYELLAECMASNFATRRAIYGDDVVGSLNIKVVELATSFGLAAKFTGSGGAIVCLRTLDTYNLVNKESFWFSQTEEDAMRRQFSDFGFNFVRIETNFD